MIEVVEVVGAVLLWVLIAVAAVAGLALLMPLTFRVAGAADDDDGLSWKARVAWGFGVVALHAGNDGGVLRLLGVPVWRFDGERAKRREERRDKKRKKPNKRAKPGERAEARGLAWWLSRRHLLVTIIGRYLRALHVRGEVEGVVGLANPDDTARLYQVLAAIDVVLPEGVLAVEVDWVEEVVQLRGQVGGWIWPLQVVAITAWLFLDRATWRALKARAD